MRQILTRWLIVICVNLFPPTIFCQPADSLITHWKNQLLQSKTDTARLEAITNLIWEYRMVDLHQADSLANEEMKMATRIRHPYWISMAWNDKAILALRKSDLQTALHCLHESLAIREKLGRADLLASTYSKLGNAYTQLHQTEKGLNYLFKALSHYEKLGKKIESGIILSAIGSAFVDLKDSHKAIQYLDRAASLFLDAGDDYSYHTALANMANAYADLKKPQKAIELLKKCELAFEKFGDANGLANVLGSLGLCYRQMNDQKNGLWYYQKAIRICAENGDSVGLAVYGHNLGSTFLDLGKYDSARFQFSKAERICQRLKLVEQYKMVKFSQIKLALLQSAPNQVQLLEQFKRLSDTLERQQNVSFAQEMDVRYGTELREAKIRNLSTENRLKKLEIKEKETALQNARWLILLSVGLMVSLVIGGLVYYSRQKIKSQLALSKALAEEQKRGLEAVIEAQEKERTQIAAELHDSIGQQLGALKFKLENQPEAADLLLKSMTELRQISHRMMPLTLSRFGLEKAIAELLEEVLKPAGIRFEFDTWNLPPDMPEALKLTIYRCLQEIVQNVQKHAEASHFSVQLYATQHQLIVRTEDNGKEIALENNVNGMGMLNLKTRISSQNGTLTMENGPENGLITTMRFGG